MKIGPRKPSIKKSIKARTTGKLKRKVKRSINPTYGKKGSGWAKNPKKAAYNKVYNKTTFGINDAIKSSSKKPKNNIYKGKSYNTTTHMNVDYLPDNNIYDEEKINLNNSKLSIFERVLHYLQLFLGLIQILFYLIVIGVILYFVFVVILSL